MNEFDSDRVRFDENLVNYLSLISNFCTILVICRSRTGTGYHSIFKN